MVNLFVGKETEGLSLGPTTLVMLSTLQTFEMFTGVHDPLRPIGFAGPAAYV